VGVLLEMAETAREVTGVLWAEAETARNVAGVLMDVAN
jgi:hypothetical protein